MPTNGTPPNPVQRQRNTILNQLPEAEYEALAKFMVPVELPLR